MGIEKTAFELITLTYDAALAPEKWPSLMKRLVEEMGARSALLREVDYKGESVGLFETVNYDPAYVAAYREHYVHHDYFSPILLEHAVGTVMTGEQAIPWGRQIKTEFCNDYLLAQGIRYPLGITLARNDRYHLLFAMQRELGQGGYDEEDLRLIHLLAPHMARAVQINRQMAEVTSQKQWALAALDRLRVGVVLLDAHGRPIHLNQEAERLASGRNGFVANRNGLTVSSSSQTTLLRRLIADAAGLAAGKGCAAGGCLRVNASESGEPTLQFQVIPLSRDHSERPWGQSLCGCCVAVFVSALGGPCLPWKRVAAMHGLTRAEARLASTLANGISLEETAEKLLVSIQTARSQLKSVFAKTGVTRQAELVALILTDMLNDQADMLSV